jgi:cell division protein FtsB
MSLDLLLTGGSTVVVVQLLNWWLARRKQAQSERLDPVSAAATATGQMAGAVSALVEPLRLEVLRLSTQVNLQRDEIQALTHENQALKKEIAALRLELAAARRGS